MTTKLPVSTKKKSSGSEDYDELIKAFAARFDKMISAIGRTHKELYAFLGYVYESAAKIDESRYMRGLLITDVERIINEGREGKRKWTAHGHDTFDLLLTLKTKLAPDLAASKSGWLQSLRAASQLKDDEGNPAPLRATEAAFIEWITPKGVSGARKLAKSSSDFNLCEFAEGLHTNGSEFTIDLPSEAEPPENMLAVLARVISREGNKAKVETVEVVLDQRRVTGLSAWTVKCWDKHNRSSATKLSRKMKKRRQQEFGDPGEPEAEPDGQLAYEDVKELM